MDLQNFRQKINKIDEQMIQLFKERMTIVAKIAAYKNKYNLPILNAQYEHEKLQEIAQKLPLELKNYAQSFYNVIFEISRDYQKILTEKN